MSPMSFPRFAWKVAATGLFVLSFLLLDRPGLPAQLVLGIGTGLFLAWLVRGSSVPTLQVGVAIAIATTGECVLSLVWGLYEYRVGAIPFYVPFGHGIFYALAYESSRQVPLQRHAQKIVPAVLVVITGWAVAAWALVGDAWGMMWWAGAVAIVFLCRDRLLMASCFVYTALLEWAGTIIGNWKWAAVVPGLGLGSGNPPSGVGILYCVLDLLTVTICTRLAARPVAVEEDLRGLEPLAQTDSTS